MPPPIRVAFRLGRELFTLSVVALTLGYAAAMVFHFEPLTMLTGSMGKAIPPGSLVLTRSVPPSTLEVGDVITFQKPSGLALDTHRIVRIEHAHGHTTYRTKGDANAKADPWKLQFNQTQSAHRVVYSLPHVGRPLLWERDPLWTFVLVGTIALIVLSTIGKVLAGTSEVRDLDHVVAAENSRWRTDQVKVSTSYRSRHL
jgi:signal peptidase